MTNTNPKRLTLKRCGDCAFWKHFNGQCPFLQSELPAESVGCAKFLASFSKCDVCGNQTTYTAIDLTNPEEPINICGQCAKMDGTCQLCKYSYCAFEQDPSPIPKKVQKQIRQGNAVIITEVLNPARIEKFCKDGCICFSEEFGCLKQFKTCGNWSASYLRNKNKE